MCTGAILLYKIPRVVIGENENFQGDEELLRSRGVEVIVVNDEECKKLMKSFIREHPEVSPFFYTSNYDDILSPNSVLKKWYEDIGEVP